MTRDEILACARQAQELGYGTVVLQAGEDYGLTRDGHRVVRAIKAETALAVTLSLGERPDEDLAPGARRAPTATFSASRPRTPFSTPDPPRSGPPSDRFACSGGCARSATRWAAASSSASRARPSRPRRDLVLFRDLDLDMIGVGPFIPHPSTPLGRGLFRSRAEGGQVPTTS